MYGAHSLYNNTSGSNGTITLSSSAANFTYLDIYYKNNNGIEAQTTRVYAPNGQATSLYSVESNSSNATYIRRTKYTISGTSLTPSCLGYITASSAFSWSGVFTTNYIYIYKVIGYK